MKMRYCQIAEQMTRHKYTTGQNALIIGLYCFAIIGGVIVHVAMKRKCYDCRTSKCQIDKNNK